MDELLWKEVDESLFSRAMEHDSPKLLFRLGCEYLMSSRVIRPGVVWLLEHVATARAAANAATWQRLAHLATPQRRVEMDGLLVVDPSLGFTRLHWLSRGPEPASPAAVKAELEKLTFLRRLDAHELDLSMLPVERRRALATAGRRATGQSLQRKEEQRRYPILLTVLAQSAVDVLDDLLLLFDQAISGRESHAKAKLREKLAERAKSGEDRQALLDEILAVLLDTGVDDEQVGMLIRNGIGMERLRAARAEAKPRLPRDHGHLAILDGSLTYLRKFTSNVLAALRFAGGTEAAPPPGELAALAHAGPPFFRADWGVNVVGMVLDDETDWVEVAELVTDSYRVQAPRRLAFRLKAGG